MGLFSTFCIASIVAYVITYIMKRVITAVAKVNAIYGPAVWPIIGNLHQIHLNPDEFFEQLQGIAYMRVESERMCRVWFYSIPFVILYGAEECEAVLSSAKMLKKPFQYKFMAPWIGEGLLIRNFYNIDQVYHHSDFEFPPGDEIQISLSSDPSKWRGRRKLLTPTFHYDILKDFVEVYNRHALTLTNKFEQFSDTEQFIDIFHTITLCTLDIICEAALGICIDAQNKQTDYLDAVFRMKHIIHQRQAQAQFYPDFSFNWFGRGKEMARCVKIVQDFTMKVINERKRMVDEAGGVDKLLAKEIEAGKRKMAFLDLMLDMNSRGELPLEGIREEVDTFTFEGHDTTSAAMNWALHLIAANPEVQTKIHQELDTVFEGSERPVTFEDLGRLTFLEACVKETLRLYPSVPIFARQVTQDVQIKNKTLPAGTSVIIVPSMVHRDPRYWKDPEVFRPQRFLDEKNDRQHPFAYIPFSAGSRNCIGQRFAMMEEKCVLAIVLRRLKVYPKLRTDQMRVAAELIIRPMYGNYVRFERRDYGHY